MMYRRVTPILTAMFLVSAALAEVPPDLPDNPPMPLERPLEAPMRPGDTRPRPPQLLQIPPEEIETAAKFCSAVLAKNKLVAEPAQAVLWSNGCGAVGQLSISAIQLADGKRIPLRPAALIRCEIAEAIADWVREDLVPITEAYGGLARIDVAASYHCRPRNNIRGALLSEHGRANAIDRRRGGYRLCQWNLPSPPTPIANPQRAIEPSPR